jgi:hypothetical protein
VKPTLHVTNWPSTKLHGFGPKFTIMAEPRHWEKGDGRVVRLTPPASLMRAAKDGRLSLEEYRAAYLEHVAKRGVGPGDLYAAAWVMRQNVFIRNGDTLCCACSREKAAYGECHRVWAAEALVAAGWRVVLDGKELVP